MSIEEMKARQVKVDMEAFNKGNNDAWDEMMAPDIVFHLLPGTEIKGLEAFKQFFAGATLQGFSERKFQIDEIIGEGNTTALRYTLRMKHTGFDPIAQVPPTGKEVVLKSYLFCHWKDGKIVEVFENVDMLSMLQQLGVIPPMGQK